QELEDGVRSVAAPLLDHDGRVLGSVNLSAHATRTNLDALRKQFLPALLETTSRINEDLSRRR
ncbi:MAG: transcriptional regulator, IclR family, partial [Ilumatobacteraceae bacterium]|nr:transcriptional regulator, IclR family [Ilumatobacteraceae bacterium]